MSPPLEKKRNPSKVEGVTTTANVQHVHRVIFDREKGCDKSEVSGHIRVGEPQRESVNFPVPADIVQEMS